MAAPFTKDNSRKKDMSFFTFNAMRKKHIIVIAIFATILAYGGYSVRRAATPSKAPENAPPAQISQTNGHPAAPSLIDGTGCDPALNLFIYHPQRLKVIDSCRTITGTLINFVKEADGDFHGRVQVNDQALINADNVAGQHGYLVIEGVCQYHVTQSDAVGPCSSYNGPNFGDLNRFVGKKIQVSGAFVQDAQHNKGNGGWLEIHPVSKIIQVN